jgi:hypothetical protein
MSIAKTHPFDPARQHRRAMFHYSAYWGAWSLVLTHRCKASPGYGPTVEICLTPINDGHAKQVLAINVRRHCTDPADRDIFTDALPAEVREQVFTLFGATTANWLLDPATEILGKIDWQAQRDKCNGGASLYTIVHPAYRDQLPVWEAPWLRTA